MTGTSPFVRKKWERFKRIRRGYGSLLIIVTLYLISLGSELIANNKAILVRYDGRYFYPFLRYYPESLFGGATNAEPNYRALKRRLASEGMGNWVIMPPIPYGPYETLLDLPGNPPHPPSSEHWLGTDDRGRDVLVRLLYGFRISMTFSLEVTVLATALGVFIGALQGYYGGKFDILVQRLIEIWATLPFLYIVIIVSSIFKPSFHWLVFILFLFNWMGMTFYMRGEFYREKSRDYVPAARALGATDTRIIFGHILPNALTPIITFLPFSLVGNIFALTSLDFLGFGLPAPTPSWGELMQQGMGNIYSYWLSLSPVAALFFTLLLITFVGEAAREAFDPREYQRLV
ncbi:MAG: ABC transporter permease [Deltaproteobacteria bacterium]|nr:ABC transporter permease [Deltaproteobacteria bacterium]MBW2307445.1 ABC transporter permease [Deltaproteobacteria bacterium]